MQKRKAASSRLQQEQQAFASEKCGDSSHIAARVRKPIGKSALRRWSGRLVKLCVYTALSIAVFLLVIMPLLVKIFPSLPKDIVYLNAVRIPWLADLSQPLTLNLTATRNLYVESEKGIQLGVWHTLPEALVPLGAGHLEPPLSESAYERLLSNGLPIMLYCHGNTGTRAAPHRVALYRVLSKMNYHVVSLDYRGYGDSTGTPSSEAGVVHDVKFLYKWIKARSGESPVYLWGHSLGTGICGRAMTEMTAEMETGGSVTAPQALILESPFNNLVDATFHHKIGKLFNSLWWFEEVFIKGIHLNGIYLETDKNICSVKAPILILHAEDDWVVPYVLGKKLHDYASAHRPSHYSPLVFKSYGGHLQYAHKWICTDPHLQDTLREFFQLVQH